jgi:hypothetical protein
MTGRKKLKFISKLLFSLINFAAFSTTALAQTAAPSISTSFSVKNLMVEGQNANNLKAGKNPVGLIIVTLINNLSLVIGSLAFLAIVIGGMMFLTSGGKEQQITKGKEIIKFAIIGLVIAFSAYFITSSVQSIFYEL